MWIIFHLILIEHFQHADISHNYKTFYSYTVNQMFQMWQINVGGQYRI